MENDFNVNYHNEINYVGSNNTTKFSEVFKDKINIIGFMGLVVAAIGSFLDFLILNIKVGNSEISESINYFMNNGDIKDGAFIFCLMIAMIFMILKNKNSATLILTGISSWILIMNIILLSQRINEIKDQYSILFSKYDMTLKIGPAPFVVGIGLILLFIHLFLRRKQIKENDI